MIHEIKSLLRLVRNTTLYRNELKEIRDCYFDRKNESDGENAVMLCEFNSLCSSHIAYAHICNALAKKNDARIVAYNTKPTQSNWENLVSLLVRRINLYPYNVYHSFGARDLVTPAKVGNQEGRVDVIVNDFMSSVSTLTHLENFSIDGVLVGDLLYEDYLVGNRVPTIDLRSDHFLEFVRKFFSLFVFWEDYFNRHKVVGVNTSHCVYSTAIPLRIALARNIPAFQTSLTHVYRLNPDNMFAYRDFVDFRRTFDQLPSEVQQAGIEDAKKRISRRFSGEVGVDMSYSTRSAFTDKKYPRLIDESKKTKVLIAAHCFFDAVHCFGNNLFPDFCEWLNFLGEQSEKTDYDWYIKTHPDFIPGNQDVLEAILAKFPRIKQLPSDASHHQIVAEGINVALTVYGTIGFEYAAMGIPVVNASLNNPHINYSFNIHPENRTEYLEKILNLDKVSLSIDTSEIYAFYFMKNIFNTDNLFAQDYQTLLTRIGGYANQFSPAFYRTWKSSGASHPNETIARDLENFLEVGDFRMSYKHLTRSSSLETLI